VRKLFPAAFFIGLYQPKRTKENLLEKMNLHAPINQLSYGVVGYNLWRQLTDIADVTLWPIGPIQPPVNITGDVEYKIDRDLLQKDINKGDNFDPTLYTLKLWHENQMAERIGKGPLIALPFFEVNKFNDRRKTHLSSADKIIVTSKWAADIVEKELGRRPFVVPCGVDRGIFNERSNEVNPHTCVFANFGKFEKRKSHDILGEAFKAAFSNGEDVSLWMMTDNIFLQPHEKAEWESKYRGDNRVQFIPRVQYQNEVAQIMSRAFCGVFPSRAEGWNLGLLEMMSMGKHVIATNYSAHTEFCTEDNCKLIDIVEEEPMYDGKWFVGDNGTWASLEGAPFDQLVEHMRDVYNLWVSQPALINREGVATAEYLTWNRMAEGVLNCIQT